MPAGAADHDDMPAHHRSVLDLAALDNPNLAIASIKRELQRMLLVIEEMMLPSWGCWKISTGAARNVSSKKT